MKSAHLSMSLVLTAALLAGCASEVTLTPIDDSTSDGAAFQVEANADALQRKETFKVGKYSASPVADYLFVIDNSQSMKRVIDTFHAGMKSLASEDPFPAKARIAVMTTMPADPKDLSSLHPMVSTYAGQNEEPGFLSLVDGRSIRRFRAEAPDEIARRYRMDGCDKRWFTPWGTNDRDQMCILAHSQISRSAVGLEAGLTALQQFLKKNDGKQTFRRGAAVNVIFISDTHSPGITKERGLVRSGIEVEPITYEQLRTLAEKDNVMASFRIHAIAPESECGEPWAHLGPRYFEVAKASGGEILDICTADNYAPFIKQIAGDGARISSPIFPLGAQADEVHGVQLGGKDVDYEVLDGGRVLRLGLDALPDSEQELVVSYTYVEPTPAE